MAFGLKCRKEIADHFFFFFCCQVIYDYEVALVQQVLYWLIKRLKLRLNLRPNILKNKYKYLSAVLSQQISDKKKF